MSEPAKRDRGKRPRDVSSEPPLDSQGLSPFAAIATSQASLDGNPGGTMSSSSLRRAPNAVIGGPSQLQKIAIPALKPASGQDSQRHHKKGRTPHACDNCRKAKSACTGGQPCGRCESAGQACVYGDGKRDKDRKRLAQLSNDATILSQHNSDICDALRQIQDDKSMPSDKMRDEIGKVLAMQLPDLSTFTSETPSLGAPNAGESSSGGDEDDFGSSASPEMAEKGSRNVVSHSSKSMAWAARLGSGSRGRTQPVIGGQDFSRISTLVSYHTEDSDVNYCDISDLEVFKWPEQSHADALVKSYFEIVHPAAPLLDQQEFMARYNSFPKTSNNISQNNHSQQDLVFLGTLNMVWAISSVYSQLTKHNVLVQEDEHIFFLARAKSLCLETGGGRGILFETARLDTTCALGLYCLYFIATCSLDKAFTFCGLALSQAISLGLHLRNEDTSPRDPLKEYHSRVWWTLYSFECLLNGLKGRPSCISDRDISVHMPTNIDIDTKHPVYDPLDDVVDSASQAQSNTLLSPGFSSVQISRPQILLNSRFAILSSVHLPSLSSYFMSRIQLCKISHEMFTKLYCAAIGKIDWTIIQGLIGNTQERRQKWYNALPRKLSVGNKGEGPDWTNSSMQQSMGLAIENCYLGIVLFRPCLCRFDNRKNHSKPVNQDSHNFDQEAVIQCVKAAVEMVTLLSATIQSGLTLYAFTPWWATLHYLCEALSVLLLEMAYQSQLTPLQPASNLDTFKKGITWLNTMSKHSISARKAWEIYDCLVRHIAPPMETFDLPNASAVPSSYRLQTPTLQPTIHQDMFQHQDPDVTAWQHDQHNQHHGFPFESFDSSYESPPLRSMVPNPLSVGLALEKFATQVRLHGQYDDNTWKGMFRLPEEDQEVGGMSQQSIHSESSGLHTTLQMPFDPSLEGFDGVHGDFEMTG